MEGEKSLMSLLWQFDSHPGVDQNRHHHHHPRFLLASRLLEAEHNSLGRTRTYPLRKHQDAL